MEKIKSKLGAHIRFLIWAKKTITEQIVFIQSPNHLRKVAMDMKIGKTVIYTKMERKIMNDIRDLKRKRFIDDLTDLQLKDMKRTQDFMKFGQVASGYFSLIFQIFATYSDSLCYLLMIISMMKNAGLVSLIYPVVVFGFAIMEEINPKKKFWYAIMIYTEVLILVKFLFQLSFWDAIYWDYEINAFQDKLVSCNDF